MNYLALIDCNNFYVSCERIFAPHLKDRPVIVLSNNDGCVVARSQEAKQLGINMCAPFFQIKEQCERAKVVTYSSNYCLYGDISNRIMSILADMNEEIEVYSIDEAFITFPTHMSIEKILAHCEEIRRRIKQWIGVPVSIGIAPTKTLCKIAGTFAKKKSNSIFSIHTRKAHEAILKEFLIEDIWGVGTGTKTKLHARRIYTAWELQAQDTSAIRRLLGVVGERIVWELRGKSCIPFEEVKDKKSITSSRSFGRAITTETELAEALSTYTNTACLKLRKQNGCAKAISVFTETSLDITTGSRNHRSIAMPLPFPTNDTPLIITAAKHCLKKLYVPEQRYKKCGIILLDLMKKKQIVPDFFMSVFDDKRDRLAEVYDSLNHRYGRDSLFYGAMGTRHTWKMRSEKSSNHYTTNWNELALVKA